jgi:hypothetical protein
MREQSPNSKAGGIICSFRRKEINRIRELVEEHREELLEAWNEFFGG